MRRAVRRRVSQQVFLAVVGAADGSDVSLSGLSAAALWVHVAAAAAVR